MSVTRPWYSRVQQEIVRASWQLHLWVQRNLYWWLLEYIYHFASWFGWKQRNTCTCLGEGLPYTAIMGKFMDRTYGTGPVGKTGTSKPPNFFIFSLHCAKFTYMSRIQSCEHAHAFHTHFWSVVTVLGPFQKLKWTSVDLEFMPRITSLYSS